MKMLLSVLLLALAVGHGSESRAQDVRDQPVQEVFQTELVYPQEKGAFQFTTTSTFARVNKKFSNEFNVEYGLTDAWQIDLQWQSFARKQNEEGLISQGSGDLQIGTKYSFMSIGGTHFHSAIGFELGIPAGSEKKGISEREIEYEPFVIVARDFPGLSRLQLFSQLGLSFAHSVARSAVSDHNPNERTIVWNSGFFVPYRQTVFTTEINWNKSAGESELYITPGMVWRLPRELELGVGLPLGLSRDADGLRMIIKLVYEFGGARDSRKED